MLAFLLLIITLWISSIECLRASCPQSPCRSGDTLTITQPTQPFDTNAGNNQVLFKPPGGGPGPLPCCSDPPTLIGSPPISLSCKVLMPPGASGNFNVTVTYSGGPDNTPAISFAAIAMSSLVTPAQVVNNVPLRITFSDATGAFKFQSGDEIQLRDAKGDCTGTILTDARTTYQGSTSSTITVGFMPKENTVPVPAVEACFRRQQLTPCTAPMKISTENFKIHPDFKLSIQPSTTVAQGFPFRVTISNPDTGFSSFQNTDSVVFKKGNCQSGGELGTDGTPIYSGSSSTQRVITFVPNEAAPSVVVCLQRNNLDMVAVDPSTTINVVSLDRSITPTEPSDRVPLNLPFQIEIDGAGYNLFSDSTPDDKITLRKNNCQGPQLLLGNGPIYTATKLPNSLYAEFTAAEPFQQAVVCLSRQNILPNLGTVAVAQIGTTFKVISLTTLFDNQPTRNVQFTASVTGLQNFNTADSMSFRRNSCTGQLIPSFPTSPALTIAPNRIDATTTPTREETNVVLCLQRGNGLPAQIGNPFSIGRIQYSIEPGQAHLGIPLQVSLSGVSDFSNSDAISIRSESCSGTDLAPCQPNALACASGSGSTRQAVLVPTTETTRAVVCLSRDGGPPALLEDANSNPFFPTAGALSYSVRPAEPVKGFPFVVSIRGASTLGATDFIVLKKGSCDNTALSISGSGLPPTGTGNIRTITFTPNEIANNVVVCLSRSSLPLAEIKQREGFPGSTFDIVELAYTLNRQPAKDFSFTVTLTGTSYFNNDDVITINKDDCNSSIVATNVKGITHSSISVFDSVRRGTLIPTEAHNPVVVCLQRDNSSPVIQIGSEFKINELEKTVTPLEPAQDIQFAVVVTGVSDFNTNDILSLRKDTCNGSTLSTATRLSGSLTERVATIAPAENYPTVVTCLSRDNGPNRVQIGPTFTIAPKLTLDLQPSKPARNFPMVAQITGVCDFNNKDRLSIRKDSCTGSAVQSTSSVTSDGNNCKRSIQFTPSEAAQNVVLCLARDGTPLLTQVGSTFSIADNLQYTLEPSDVAVGVEFKATVTGVSDFGSKDEITFREDNCNGPIINGAMVSNTGTGSSRTVAFIAQQVYSNVALCLSRNGMTRSQVGSTFSISSIGCGISPTIPTVGNELVVTITGVTSFTNTDALSFHRDTCAGGQIMGTQVRLSGSGTSRMATFTPREAYTNVVACLSRGGGPMANVCPKISISMLRRTFIPVEPSRGMVLRTRIEGSNSFNDFNNNDVISIHRNNCNDEQIETLTTSILSGTGESRTYVVTPHKAYPMAVVCLKRGVHPVAQVGDVFAIVEPQPVIKTLKCENNAGLRLQCGDNMTLTIEGLSFDENGKNTVHFSGGYGGPPTCSQIKVLSATTLECTLHIPDGTGDNWNVRLEVNNKACCAPPDCGCAAIYPPPSLTGIKGCTNDGRTARGCVGGTNIILLGAQFDSKVANNNNVKFVCSSSGTCGGTPPTCGPMGGPQRLTSVTVKEITCPLSIAADTQGIWNVELTVNGYKASYQPVLIEPALMVAPVVSRVKGCIADGVTHSKGCSIGSVILLEGKHFDGLTTTNNVVEFQCCTTCGVQCIGTPSCRVIASMSNTISCVLEKSTAAVKGHFYTIANVMGKKSAASATLEATICGDGEKSSIEECDDGNTSINDGCSPTCTLEFGWICPSQSSSNSGSGSSCKPNCGDGIRISKEECDDANKVSGDGCSSSCMVETVAGFTCSGVLGGPSTCVRCGDGQKQQNETCDDNNTNSGDGCSPTCTVEPGWTCTPLNPLNSNRIPDRCTAICGDSIQTTGEQCDDGNSNNGDGCSSTCQTEKFFSCTGEIGKRTLCTPVIICGDGIKQARENCDDGVPANGDGCSTRCDIEPGWTCTGKVGEQSVCIPVCGDGMRYGQEACDDSNLLSGDGCNSSCQIEAGYVCAAGRTGTVSACIRPNVCGDGNLASLGSEECDDGNTISGDGCSPSCVKERGWDCTTAIGQLSSCNPVCGDSIRLNVEFCDDGNSMSNDGCSNTCQIENGYSCTGKNRSVCVRAAVCGNGKAEQGEDCDDGNTRSGDGCTPTCRIQTGWSCTASQGATSTCAAICGDGLRMIPEECDDGNKLNGDGCSASCKLEAGFGCGGAIESRSFCSQVNRCSDGQKGEKEECDDGNTVGGDGCNPACRVERGWFCVSPQQPRSTQNQTSVCSPVCGDGIRLTGEPCDDSNSINGDGCSRECKVEPGFVCGGLIGQPSSCTLPTLCGDGVRHTLEPCDDANLTPGDGCDPSCNVEPKWTCSGATGDMSVCLPTCGDGHLLIQEACDDNNLVNGDGCNDLCKVELGWRCSSLPDRASNCSAVDQCGNGIRTPEEQCDDGNRVSNDGCTSGCKVEVGWTCNTVGGNAHNLTDICQPKCGDGQRTKGEECDDGNNISGDGCSANCKIEPNYQCSGSLVLTSSCRKAAQCGDGVRAAVEQCDDANTDSGDGCAPNCKIENGFSCTATIGATSVCEPVCGDNIKTNTEECDDGNRSNGDGCSATCVLEPGFTCVLTQLGSTCTSVCGDGMLASTELCDDGNTNNGDGCTSQCRLETTHSCSSTLGLLSVCTPTCGDGIRAAVEYCDDGNLIDGDGCNKKCVIEPSVVCVGTIGQLSHCGNWVNSCGDGSKTINEECDDGNNVNGDGCSPTCVVEAGYQCTILNGLRSSCSSICGDGYRTANEGCDDANRVNGDGCNKNCNIEQNRICVANLGATSKCTDGCGNGYKAPDEQCDDGNRNSNDGCSTACLIEQGFDCATAVGGTSRCIQVRCGDGVKSRTEACDDGNNIAGDGCAPNCEVESAWSCTTTSLTTASLCVMSKACGDGIVHPEEQCDDGNNGSGDGCNACLLERGFACTNVVGRISVCAPVCGDGERQLREQCDDGNKIGGDGCSRDCTVEPGYGCTARLTFTSSCILTGRGVVSISPATTLPAVGLLPSSGGLNAPSGNTMLTPQTASTTNDDDTNITTILGAALGGFAGLLLAGTLGALAFKYYNKPQLRQTVLTPTMPPPIITPPYSPPSPVLEQNPLMNVGPRPALPAQEYNYRPIGVVRMV